MEGRHSVQCRGGRGPGSRCSGAIASSRPHGPLRLRLGCRQSAWYCYLIRLHDASLGEPHAWPALQQGVLRQSSDSLCYRKLTPRGRRLGREQELGLVAPWAGV